MIKGVTNISFRKGIRLVLFVLISRTNGLLQLIFIAPPISLTFYHLSIPTQQLKKLRGWYLHSKFSITYIFFNLQIYRLQLNRLQKYCPLMICLQTYIDFNQLKLQPWLNSIYFADVGW